MSQREFRLSASTQGEHIDLGLAPLGRVIPIEEGEAVYGPSMLPDGDQVLFTLRPAGTLSWDESQIVVESLASGERTVLIEGGRDARYLTTGHLVYALQGTVLAQVFDLGQLAMRGGPVSLIEDVRAANGGLTAAAQFSVSRDGTLIYLTGDGLGDEWGLVWVDHDGLVGAALPVWDPARVPA